MDHLWGLRLAEEGPVWGGRAIDNRGRPDLLWDRQQARGGSQAERQALVDWVNSVGLPRLRRECADLHDEAPHNVMTIAEGGYVAQAKRLGGYFYLGACQERHYK